jgi:hypothetical protein
MASIKYWWWPTSRESILKRIHREADRLDALSAKHRQAAHDKADAAIALMDASIVHTNTSQQSAGMAAKIRELII